MLHIDEMTDHELDTERAVAVTRLRDAHDLLRRRAGGCTRGEWDELVRAEQVAHDHLRLLDYVAQSRMIERNR